jgi:hypothetical protein
MSILKQVVKDQATEDAKEQSGTKSFKCFCPTQGWQILPEDFNLSDPVIITPFYGID